MHKLLLISLLVFIINLGSSQSSENLFYLNIAPINIKSNYQLGRKFDNYLRSNLSTHCKLVTKSSITLKPSVNTDATYRIEGMDTKVIGHPRLIIKIKERNLGRDTSFVFESKINASNKGEMTSQLVDEFMNKAEVVDQFRSLLLDFVAGLYEANCETIIDKTNNQLEGKKYEEALRLVTNLLPVSACHEKAQNQRMIILKEYGKYVCDNKIQKARIMVNSGIAFQLSRAVRILLTIPPNSICSQEALTLSNEIGKQNSLNKESTKILHQYQNYYNGDVGSWEIYYLDQIYR